MTVPKLTQEEADKLLKMLKRSLVAKINFPDPRKSEEFDVIGDTKNDRFSIKIYRGKLNPLKYDFGARIKVNNILLLELHICSSAKHLNPDGKKIIGDHWHIYTEEYERKFAFPAENINSSQFVENTIMFLTEFNVIKKPDIYCCSKLF